MDELELHMQQPWDHYGVPVACFKEELQTWYWKSEWVNHKGKRKEIGVLAWKGIGVTIQESLDKKIAAVRAATTPEERLALTEKAKRLIQLIALYLWAMDKATGPASSRRLMNQASKAESLSRYLAREGNQDGAYQQLQRARELRKAAGSDNPVMPKKEPGIIDRLRLEFAKVDVAGKLAPRPLYIAAGEAIGVHPGTCAVQYARWKREKAV